MYDGALELEKPCVLLRIVALSSFKHHVFLLTRARVLKVQKPCVFRWARALELQKQCDFMRCCYAFELLRASKVVVESLCASQRL